MVVAAFGPRRNDIELLTCGQGVTSIVSFLIVPAFFFRIVGVTSICAEGFRGADSRKLPHTALYLSSRASHGCRP